jgi:hypothetical protein
MFARDLSPTGSLFDDSSDVPAASVDAAALPERLDSLRTPEHSPTLERFAPAWGELLQRAVQEPGLICDAYSRFHGYSLGNRFAALIQCQLRGLEPGPLNSFNGWRKLGYGVQEGQKALTLCMPLKGTLHREKTGAEEKGSKKSSSAASNNIEANHPDTEQVQYIRAFVWKPSWFVLSHTVPLNEETAPVPAPAPLAWDQAQALTALEISLVPFTHLDGNALGFARQREVSVSPLAPYPFKTLFHELAHVVLGHTTPNFRGDGNSALALSDGEELGTALIEVEAESVALLLLATLDLPGQEFCRGYIQHWMAGVNIESGSQADDQPGSRGEAQAIPEKSAQRIFGAADRILCAGVGEVRHRAPTAEEIGATTGAAHSEIDRTSIDRIDNGDLERAEISSSSLPPLLPPLPYPAAEITALTETSVPAPQASIAQAPVTPSLVNQTPVTQEGLPPPPELPSVPLNAPSEGAQAPRLARKQLGRDQGTTSSETDAWALYGHLQQLHSELHPSGNERSASFASGLRHLKGRDVNAAREVQNLVKSASRHLKMAFQMMELVLDSADHPESADRPNNPEGDGEFDPFAGMAAGEVRYGEVRYGEARYGQGHDGKVGYGKARAREILHNSSNDSSDNDSMLIDSPPAYSAASLPQDGRGEANSLTNTKSAAVTLIPDKSEPLVPALPLSPTRQAAARRTVGRSLRTELQAEKDRFSKAAKRQELPLGRSSEKAMIAAIAAYLELPLTSRRDLSSHQWARCASAIETEDLRWEKP